jgi:chemotaxis protein MotB
MSRRKRHEDHVNHEAWAIPYGDLVTLLLAFFVVMYAISSVNEGKYRVLSDSLAAAFRGTPKSVRPIQIGESSPTDGGVGRLSVETRSITDPGLIQRPSEFRIASDELSTSPAAEALDARAREMEARLTVMADEIRQALAELIDLQLVQVRQTPFWLEVEVKTDILFQSGVARISDSAIETLELLAKILRPFPNPIRVEGHTDNVPISTERFPSNWELSAARASSVVRLFQANGIEVVRLAAIGLGEYRPVADNDTAAGRNRNRRVVVVILADDRLPEQMAREETANEELPAGEAPAPVTGGSR